MAAILHMDMDAFFASVEILLNPALKGKPVAVGGRNPSGIVTTASYEARKYGIHSAMPMFMAKSLCPNLIVVPTRKGVYGEKSREVFDIIRSYGYPVEQVSIDEAYVDLSAAENPVAVAKDMQRRIIRTMRLSVSCGLSYNKFLAKIASDMEKPKGFTIIRKDEAQEILKSLPISKIHGIGEKTEKRLARLGLHTGEDLLLLERSFLEDEFGKLGIELYERIRGVDRRKVETERKRKSIGGEETFKETRNRKFFEELLWEEAQKTAMEMEKKGITGYTVTVKMKTFDFHTHTKSRTFDAPVEDGQSLYEASLELFNEFYGGQKLRLLGLSVSSLINTDAKQLRFL